MVVIVKATMEQKEIMKARRQRLKKQKKLTIGRKKRLTELLEETGGDLGGQDDINKWIDPTVYSDSNNLLNESYGPISYNNNKNCLYSLLFINFCT